MDIRYNVDADTGLPHIYEHGVREDEVEYVLKNPGQILHGPDRSQNAYGQTAHGRHLRVVFVPDKVGDGVFVVTAYQLHGRQLKSYRKRKRR